MQPDKPVQTLTRGVVNRTIRLTPGATLNLSKDEPVTYALAYASAHAFRAEADEPGANWRNLSLWPKLS